MLLSIIILESKKKVEKRRDRGGTPKSSHRGVKIKSLGGTHPPTHTPLILYLYIIEIIRNDTNKIRKRY